METQASDMQSVILNIAPETQSWNRERSLDELRDFVNSRHAAIADIEE